MLFTSQTFFVFLLITFVLFYLTSNKKIQILILILASFIFYAWNYPMLLLLLVSSIAINVVVSYLLVAYSFNSAKRKMIATLGVAINLSILIFFKYSPLLGKTFFDKESSIGEFLIAIPLPIGISFFTFQSISLVVDTFKENKLLLPENKKLSFTSHLFNTSLFIAYFPQLIAGPIVKAYEFLPQIHVKLFRNIDWEYCFKNLIIGYFLKMVVADNLKDHTWWVIGYDEFSVFSLLLFVFGYSMQIFADFAGYSLIAIGLAGLFGYHLNTNFLFPYIATSFSEFWKRWHISLSSFLKEYLYIPLGGSRKGNFRTYFNLMTTMTLGGLWHGAAWSYAVWGIYHGGLLCLERFFLKRIRFLNRENNFSLIFKGMLIFTLVSWGWLFFMLPDFKDVSNFFVALYKNDWIGGSFSIVRDLGNAFFILLYSLPVISYHLYYLLRERKQSTLLEKWNPCFYAVMLFMILFNSGRDYLFIYFQF